jgi:hypothetical protein
MPGERRHQAVPMTDPDVPTTPDNARWVRLSDEMLASDEGSELRALVEQFEPTPHEAGRQMAQWLAEAFAAGSVPEETYALHTDDRLLGFFAVRRAQIKLSWRAWPLFELRKRVSKRQPIPGLILSSIVRAASTPPGFGRILFDYALAVALRDQQIAAVVLQPENEAVSRLWRKTYDFRPMDHPETPGLLYFPVDPAPGATWP